MVDPNTDYTRAITHEEYTFQDERMQKVGLITKLDKRLYEDPKLVFKADRDLTNIHYIDDEFFVQNPYVKGDAVWGGGAFGILLLAAILIILTGSDDDEVTSGIILWLIFLTAGFSFFAYYYFTMPKKELIFNRRDGLVTFPGFMWHQNITMPIHSLEFTYSGPSAQGIGAFELRIIRPDKMKSGCTGVSYGQSCYKDISFYLWYMDKNRPLPPGTAFDPFRQKDFDRRKAAGFPPPMFPSSFPTPEANAEHQAERDQYWKETLHTNLKGQTSYSLHVYNTDPYSNIKRL